MARLSRRIALVAGCALGFAGLASAQGRGGASWNTAGNDAQRTSFVATDPNISVPNLQKPGFQYLWKVKANNDARQDQSLSQALTVASYIGYRGFRSYAFVGGSSNNAIALDSDLGRIEWARHFDVPNPPAGTAACPGGMTAGVTRPTTLGISAVAAAPVAAAAGRGAVAAVGQPNQGAVQIAAVAAGGGRGGRGGSGGGGRGPAAFGANDLFAVSSDGMLHVMYMSNGADAMAPIRFLPANANASGIIYTERDIVVGTKNNCGGVANGVYAIDMIGPDKTVSVWKSNGGSVVGTAFSPDGTVFATTADGDYSPAAFSDSVVALNGKGLAMKNYFTPSKSDFTTSPVVFTWQGKELVAAGNKDGHVYLLDAASLGGADHKTPLAQSTSLGNILSGDISTFEADGTRWILAPVSGALNSATRYAGNNGAVTNGAIVAFKVVNQGGKPSLQAAWSSRDLTVPQTPAIVNGVVFAVSGGDAQHAAVLYALDGSTGKDLWNSGTTMTSFTRSGVSGSASQLYVSTHDSTIYTFGFPLEK